MGFPLAFLVCALGTVGLFFLDRDESVRNSGALWLPTIWFCIVASRPISAWLGVGPTGGLDATLEGNPTDAAIFAVLLAAGILVLLRRKSQIRGFLTTSGPIALYFTYCLLSVLWSPFPDASFKRWIKAVGDLVMVLIVATDVEPVEAIRRYFSRAGFILFPLSVLLIRYTVLGRGYSPDGVPENVGVTTNKNALGVLVLVVALSTLWTVRAILQAGRQRNLRRRLVAQSTLLAFSLSLLYMAHSATSVACFVLGSGLMFVAGLRRIRRNPAAMHAVVLIVILAGGLGFLFGGADIVTGALGRDSGLTGRTDIWKAVIPMARNPIIGTGFESFWNSTVKEQRRLAETRKFMYGNLVSAHNGFIDVYLNLGLVGVGLIVMVLIDGYRRVGAAFRRDPETGSLILAYVVIIPLYNITEAGFRLFQPMWISFLLSYVVARTISNRHGETLLSDAARARLRAGSTIGETVGWEEVHSSADSVFHPLSHVPLIRHGS
jgi:exopolysaccharide production protein ExoQ